ETPIVMKAACRRRHDARRRFLRRRFPHGSIPPPPGMRTGDMAGIRMQDGFGVSPGDGGDSGAARGGEDAMLPVGECRQLVIRGRDGLRLARGAMPSWRESLATLVIGTLSTALGVAALAAQDPRFDSVYAACVGQWLGVGGICWALRIGRGMSPL